MVIVTAKPTLVATATVAVAAMVKGTVEVKVKVGMKVTDNPHYLLSPNGNLHLT